jgi:hypothetical protein
MGKMDVVSFLPQPQQGRRIVFAGFDEALPLVGSSTQG